MADKATGASESLGGCRECLVGWQMCFLAPGSDARKAGSVVTVELAGRLIN